MDRSGKKINNHILAGILCLSASRSVPWLVELVTATYARGSASSGTANTRTSSGKISKPSEPRTAHQAERTSTKRSAKPEHAEADELEVPPP
nr:unnamed protein product [Digitaria exilis]